MLPPPKPSAIAGDAQLIVSVPSNAMLPVGELQRAVEKSDYGRQHGSYVSARWAGTHNPPHVALGACWLAACGCGPGRGQLLAVTYNVDGIPQGIDGSNARVNNPLISPLLNGYDLVLLQEDFTYHDFLVRDAEHPHQSEWHESERTLSGPPLRGVP